ncbi:type II toxin-antitoxin system RelE/ParE family toxin [Thalassolituus oleivorans]|uniref:type II toxin-antitoxin system RelE/ParE family toxin n=1 Tax=Thalassolituus oleivorans TaxID=187493 RepID=UPI00042DC558|nr:type II toxin-antitoxin system RelE/ParE family toxin [Thalassolituus oleivorans]AHK15225.1 transcription elongation factor GreB [Thalassolituus oleivorans R6-15]
MLFIETSVFTQTIKELMSDDEYRELQEELTIQPDKGDVIQGTGGIRKIRAKATGRGKRGGSRVIYYWRSAHDQILMLLAYPKNDQDDLSPDQKKVLKAIVENWH